MAIGLGIDTGGTYTDAALVDLDYKKILAKGKALTDRRDLCSSIVSSVKAVGKAVLDAEFVALSTTLATNAIVEGEGAVVRLIAIGNRSEIEALVPPGEVSFIEGGHKIDGSRLADLDERGLIRTANCISGQVEAVAISSYLSVRNPEHELRAKSLIHELTGLPIVCGHELTTKLGYKERTATALLNARLIPLSVNLFSDVKKALNEMGIAVPILVVKSDGTLVDIDEAMTRPVQTILSGPAAGIAGALHLAGIDSGIVVDMGGTTMDMSLIVGGSPRMNKEGAVVGGWRTRVESVNVSTIGLGGDSYIWSDTNRSVHIGPKRVLPLACLSADHSSIVPKLRDLLSDSEIKPFLGEPQDFIYKRASTGEGALDRRERDIVEALKAGPLMLCEMFNGDRESWRATRLALQKLERMGLVGRAGLTPTDILNSNEQANLWDSRASVLGVSIMARYLKTEREEFEKKILRNLTEDIACEVIRKQVKECILDRDMELCGACEKLIDAVCRPKDKGMVQLLVRSDLPLVGIGAPIEAYLPGVANLLESAYLIPAHADVASAMGAVLANVVETANLLIENASDGGFNVYSPWGKYYFKTLEQAKDFAVELGEKRVAERAIKSGASHVKITKNIYDKEVFQGGENSTFLYTLVRITATGPPCFLNSPN